MNLGMQRPPSRSPDDLGFESLRRPSEKKTLICGSRNRIKAMHKKPLVYDPYRRSGHNAGDEPLFLLVTFMILRAARDLLSGACRGDGLGLSVVETSLGNPPSSRTSLIQIRPGLSKFGPPTRSSICVE